MSNPETKTGQSIALIKLPFTDKSHVMCSSLGATPLIVAKVANPQSPPRGISSSNKCEYDRHFPGIRPQDVTNGLLEPYLALGGNWDRDDFGLRVDG